VLKNHNHQKNKSSMDVQHHPLSSGGESDAVTEDHLKEMSLLFFQLNNDQNWDGLLTADWISPKWTAAIEYRSNADAEVNLQQHVQQYAQHLLENPDYLHTTSDIEAKVEPKHGRTASVFINHTGNLGDMSIPGVAVFNWRKDKLGKWMFEKLVDMRGLPM
jgi:hypothetical protein